MKKLPLIINAIDAYLDSHNIEYVLPKEIDKHLINIKIFSEKQMHIYSTRRLISCYYIDYAFKVNSKWVIPHSRTQEIENLNVPVLKHYNHYTTPHQKLFYEGLFEQLEKNNYIDVEGYFTYIELYINKITSNFLLRKIEPKRTEDFISKLTFLLEEYGQHEIIKKMISYILSDLYVLLNDFNQAWKFKRMSYYLEIEDVVYIKSKCSNTEIDENDLLKILQSDKGLTKYGRENINSIKPLVKGFLKDFYEEYNSN